MATFLFVGRHSEIIVNFVMNLTIVIKIGTLYEIYLKVLEHLNSIPNRLYDCFNLKLNSVAFHKL